MAEEIAVVLAYLGIALTLGSAFFSYKVYVKGQDPDDFDGDDIGIMILGSLFWPITICLIVVIGFVKSWVWLLTYPHRRAKALREREGDVSRKLSPSDYYARNHAENFPTESEREVLKRLPWRKAEAWLIKRGYVK